MKSMVLDKVSLEAKRVLPKTLSHEDSWGKNRGLKAHWRNVFLLCVLIFWHVLSSSTTGSSLTCSR